MTEQQFAMIGDAIKTLYPAHKILPNQHAMDLWYSMLKDLDYEAVTIALQKYASQNTFPPTVADLRGGCAEVQNGEYKSWEEGWQEVTEAIKKYGYMREGEALHSLSAMTRKIVMRMDYQYLCSSENVMADRANFRDIYNNMVSKQKQREQLSPSVRGLLDKATERRYALPERKPINIPDKSEKPDNGDSVELSSRVQELIRKTREELKGE